MSNCCDGADKAASGSDCCCGDAGKNVLFYACSGGANVAEMADRAARELMFDGCGTMFCLAGLGAGIQGMIQTAKDADANIVIDGCPLDCARKIFDKVGVTNYKQFRVTDLGIEKVKGVRASPEDVERVIAKARELRAEV
ncbi:MAG: zinc-binding protein [Candidatus Brocadiaceae bacterium]|nr:zinc-binding protein [Candidatus Brocadiaceae bacterium]